MGHFLAGNLSSLLRFSFSAGCTHLWTKAKTTKTLIFNLHPRSQGTLSRSSMIIVAHAGCFDQPDQKWREKTNDQSKQKQELMGLKENTPTSNWARTLFFCVRKTREVSKREDLLSDMATANFHSPLCPQIDC